MNTLPFITASFTVAALVTMVLMPWLLHLCYKREIFDLPDSRKVHKNSIPRLGGIVFAPAVIIGFLAAITFVHTFQPGSFSTLSYSTVYIGSGALVIYLIGIFDDILGCSAKLKFCIQLAAACSLPACGLYIDTLYGLLGITTLPLWIAYPLTVFIILLIVNAINLIDGIDGLAAGLSLIALTAYGYLFGKIEANGFVYLCASFCGTLLAFLYFNLFGTTEKQTKTFMGDSGSLLLGIVLAYFTMKYVMEDSRTLSHRPDGLLMAFTLLLVPCFDLCRVACCRLIRHRGIFEPDKTHLHHKIMAAGVSMRKTLLLILCLQIGYILLNRIMYHVGISMEWIILADIILFSLLNVYLPIPSTTSKK